MLVLKALVVCMLRAENLTILPIGCIIGQKNPFAKSPVPELNQAPFVLGSCVQPTAYLCSTAAHSWHRVWGPKKMYRNFTAILLQFDRNLPQFVAIFSGLRDCNPPPPQPHICVGPRILSLLVGGHVNS